MVYFEKMSPLFDETFLENHVKNANYFIEFWVAVGGTGGTWSVIRLVVTGVACERSGAGARDSLAAR